jgi:hypothetical protein
MVKLGQRILEGVEVEISRIEQLLTLSPTVSNKDGIDIAQKIRYLIDKVEELLAKIQNQSAGLFVKDLSVGTDASQVDSDSSYRDEVILLADSSNTNKVYVGTSASQPFPLVAGASVAVRKTALNLIYLRAASGTQTIHVIAGGA